MIRRLLLTDWRTAAAIWLIRAAAKLNAATLLMVGDCCPSCGAQPGEQHTGSEWHCGECFQRNSGCDPRCGRCEKQTNPELQHLAP